MTGPQLDAHSDTWKVVTKWASERLATTRSELESQVLDAAGLAAKQERIRNMKAILALGDPPRPQEDLPEDPGY